MQDITELRLTERRLEAAQRLAHVGWWERDYAAGRWLTSDEVRANLRHCGDGSRHGSRRMDEGCALHHPSGRPAAGIGGERGVVARWSALRHRVPHRACGRHGTRGPRPGRRDAGRIRAPRAPVRRGAGHYPAAAGGAGGACAAGHARPCAEGGARGGIRLVHRRSRERKPLVARPRGDVWPGAGHVRSNVPRLEEARPSRRLAVGAARDQACARVRRCRGRVPGHSQGRHRALVAGERPHVLRRRGPTRPHGRLHDRCHGSAACRGGVARERSAFSHLRRPRDGRASSCWTSSSTSSMSTARPARASATAARS